MPNIGDYLKPPDKKQEALKDIPVTEAKRATCKVIRQGVMNQIDAAIQAQKDKVENRIQSDSDRAELAAQPFQEFKRKLQRGNQSKR